MGEAAAQPRQRVRRASRWLIATLLAVTAACLVVEAVSTGSAVPAGVGFGGQKGVFVVAGQIVPGMYGLYLVDLDHGTICVYQYNPSTRRLGLVAARSYVYDVQLEDYNSEKPSPREVKELTDRQRRLDETATRPKESPR